jgi:hypothetical protein
VNGDTCPSRTVGYWQSIVDLQLKFNPLNSRDKQVSTTVNICCSRFKSKVFPQFGFALQGSLTLEFDK